MPQRVVSLDSQAGSTGQIIRVVLDTLRQEMDIPQGFPPDVDAEVSAILESLGDRPAQESWPTHSVETLNIEFITIDPEGSMDLDQAVHIESVDEGYIVHYAIADVAAFVKPAGAVDMEARKRGVTLYAPDGRTPLHPPALSEGAASLLPDVVRPAAVWTISLDGDGTVRDMHVERGLVRSRQRFSYVEAQQILDELASPHDTSSGSRIGGETIALLGVVGPLRLAQERARGGVSLNVPEQEVHEIEGDGFELEFRVVLPVENFNAQISLLTGMCAARLMVDAGIGMVRTLPPADPRDLKRLRRSAHALGLNWPRSQSYGEFLDTLDSANPRHAAFQQEATTLFRGADYLSFDGDAETARSQAGKHNAIGAHYAHATAPLRRLGDRFVTEICLAVAAGENVPQWVRDVLPTLPELSNAATRRGNSYGRAATDIVEAALLRDRVGEAFTGVIIEVDDRSPHKGEVMVADPAVHGRVTSNQDLPLGEEVSVVLLEASVEKRKIKFGYGEEPYITSASSAG